MAKQRIRVLTDSSVIELQRMQTRLTNLERKQLPLGHGVEAKSVYIVRTPSGGIPAATVLAERTPGSAVCIMHRRLNNTSNASRVDTINSNATVYNFTDVDIPGSSYVLAFRDAWGDLWAVPGGTTCPDLPSPGSYPAVAGAAIAAGDIGPILYDGTVYQVKNHSQCAVRFGDQIGLHVSPKCDAFFVPCVCSCTEPEPTLACDKSYSICIAGKTHILGIGSIFNTCWQTCCTFSTGGGAIVELCGYLTCNPATNQIYFNWFAGTYFGQIELVDLFSTGTATETLNLAAYAGITSPCDVVIEASDELIDCDDCEGTPPENPCCDKLLWFCLNGDSQQLSVSNGDYTFDVTECCDTCTTSATMRIQLQCNETTGAISLTWTFTCDAGTPESGTTTDLSAFCSSNDPLIVTLDNGSVPCFLQLQVSIINAGCDGCGPTTTPP